MPRYTERADRLTLPVIPLHDAVAFPSIPFDFESNDTSAIAACDAASSGDRRALLVYITDDSGQSPNPEALARVGTVARIRQSVKDNDSESVRIICECRDRASVLNYSVTDPKPGGLITADVITKEIRLTDAGGIRGEAYCREINETLDRMVGYLQGTPAAPLKLAAKTINDPSLLTDFVAASVLVKTEDKQRILEKYPPLERAALLIKIMNSEIALLEVERGIRDKTAEQLAKNQRDYFLREQMKVIEDELGEGSDPDDYSDRIAKAKIPEELREKLNRENDRLLRTPYGSAEATVSRIWIEEVLDLPWNRRTRDRVDVAAAEKLLNDDHDGLEKVKQRILEYLAVKQLNPALKNQIICLVGPPGTGKTSIAGSIAKAMKRRFVRVSLGGIHDEADIRGHRKTYVASMPGRVIEAIRRAGSCNPLILFDEIDKLTSDLRGDPASAMIEVLDPEQNKSFRDHFIEYPFDLSECFFITTANTTEGIPKPLLDRMEVIELDGYTRTEKLSIAKHHLIPKQLKRHGLTRRAMKLTDDAVYEIIDCYTSEAGVRNLERNIASLCRKTAKQLLESGAPEEKKVVIDRKDIEKYLGGRKLLPEKIGTEDLVGVVNGLAYTGAGGDLLKVEAAVLDGTGKLELTGSLGDVMKESAKAALTYVRKIAAEYGIPADFYKTRDIHIHVPEGAVPKDGPSAGVTMVTALVSALSGLPVRHDLAMTGEVTITGRVMAIGGLREKTMAAYAAGVKTVLIPAENVMNLDEAVPEVKANIEFIPCRSASDVLREALVKRLPQIQAEPVKPAETPQVAIPPEIPPVTQIWR